MYVTGWRDTTMQTHLIKQGSIFAVIQSSMTTKTSYGQQNNMKRCLLDKLILTLPFLKFLMSFLHSDHLSSTWNFKKTKKDLQLSIEIKPSWMMWYMCISPRTITESSIFSLSTADALCCFCIHANMWHNQINCFDKDRASSIETNTCTSQIWAGRAKEFLSAFMAVKIALVPGFLVSVDSHNEHDATWK